MGARHRARAHAIQIIRCEAVAQQDSPSPGPADARLQDQVPSALQSPEAGRRPGCGQQTQDLLPVKCPRAEVSPQSQTLSLLTSFGRLVNLREIKTIHTSKK